MVDDDPHDKGRVAARSRSHAEGWEDRRRRRRRRRPGLLRDRIRRSPEEEEEGRSIHAEKEGAGDGSCDADHRGVDTRREEDGGRHRRRRRQSWDGRNACDAFRSRPRKASGSRWDDDDHDDVRRQEELRRRVLTLCHLSFVYDVVGLFRPPEVLACRVCSC